MVGTRHVHGDATQLENGGASALGRAAGRWPRQAAVVSAVVTWLKLALIALICPANGT